jgi:uncharacterized LabA/DUF88 family protein
MVYVDGFNLYYRALKDTPYKWLNLEEMVRRILSPQNDIIAIKYFTARVSARPNDPQQPVRQDIYLRALRTLPTVSIIFGTFLTTTVRMRLAQPPASGSPYVEVIKTEEKGSDVNIASHLLHDAHRRQFDVAVVVTNDSDLCEPIRLVRKELGVPVGVVYPGVNLSRQLQPLASFVRPIRKHVLAQSQFPPQLTDSVGTFHKPAVW